jgi:predicted site-specific integrase-resolvase
MSKESNTFLNASDMGDILQVNSASLRAWARQGKIPAMKLPNGRFRFNPSAVQRALDELAANGELSKSRQTVLGGALND